MEKKLLIILGLALLLLIIIYGFNNRLKKQRTTYAEQIQITSSVNVDAFIGEFHFTLYGYSSPNALVNLDGMGIYDQTYADNTGYFEFKDRFSPQAPREACLTAQDQFGRTTAPNCIPPFPTQYDATIGPIIMPPTVSLDASHYYQGDEVKLSGQTIPNSPISFSTFVDEKASLLNYLSRLPSYFSLVKPVQAFTFPQLSTQADNKGNFSLALPSSHPEFFRLFAQTAYDNSNSPQSINLNLKILPVWMIIIQFLLLLWSIIASRLLEILILGELIAITIFLIRRYTHPHVVARNRALALRKLYPLAEEEMAIIIQEKNPLLVEDLALMKKNL